MITKLSQAAAWLRGGLAAAFCGLPGKIGRIWDWLRFREHEPEPYETDDEFIASVAPFLPPAVLASKPSACPDCGGPRTDLGPDGSGHRIAQCGRCGGLFDLTAAGRPERPQLDPCAALDQLDTIWSDDFGAYASGQLDASQITCALCMCAPCRCPAFGTPEYLALVDFRHGRTRSTK
jgi:hypothetical protein